MEYIFFIVAFLIIINVSGKVAKLEGRVKRMQFTLDQLMKETGVPEHPINDELRRLVEEGEDVKAVKVARETFGFSLIEGKEYIDKLKLDNDRNEHFL